MRNLARGCIKYYNRVYDLMQILSGVEDGRTAPSIPVFTVLLSLFMGFTTRVKSFHRLEFRNQHAFKKHLSTPPSEDTLGYTLKKLGNVEALREGLFSITNKARRNKVFQGGTIDGYTVCALDGSQIYGSEVEREGWKVREKEDHKYWHMDAVALSYVGGGPSLLMDIDQIRPGEGETTAALRILRRAYREYTHFADIITLDSLYAKAPVIKEITGQRKDAVIRVKQENYAIRKDIDGLVKGEPPDETYHNIKVRDKEKNARYVYDLKIWDRDNLTSWEQVERPLRCLKIEERRKKIVHGEVIEENTETIYLVTTCEKGLFSPLTIWKIAHLRWDIENSIFNDLKNNWHLAHCFIHDPHAIKAVWLLLAMAFNLFLLLVARNIRDPRLKDAPMDALAEIILLDIRAAEVLVPT